ncbi:glycosyltransferase family A protein [Microbacterium sp. WCS2018Hpa-23]|uniref:glycosyltransferase family 2 protein n=1 Tax=Microbacterium sp. WCS2018Hpa-23 TaxID=3073634 RepID=UPI0028830279|nr:glycosyltransferase family A protein [Microbacterium sp. WCS2018Hpa-23]
MSNSPAVQPASTSIRVSVVVPVFKPGAAFDELIASLDAQTLDHSRFEVLLCDDGSGKATAARLVEVARDRDYMHVAFLPHSGWPGTPRNHGIDEARGTYIQFVDQDDWLYPGALEALCDYADQHGSDVVVGKEVGIGRRLPSRIFRRDVPQARLGEDPLLEMLTPHKMFRTSFLRDNRIRFPEGKVRLEDHLFVMRAYFEASTISILASQPCYAWVKHAGSASSSRIDPESYFPHLEAVLDLVERYTEPGRLRDRLLRHWFRGKILKRLTGKKFLAYPDEYRERLLDVVGPLAQRRFGPGVDGGLSFPNRIRAALLRADRRADLVTFARFEVETTCRAVVTSARWSRGGGLYLTVAVSITRDGQDALVVEPGTGVLTSLPVAMDGLPTGLLEAGRELQNDRVELVLRDKAAGVERRVARVKPRNLGAVALAIDPLKVFGPDDESRGARLFVTVRRAGWTFDVPLTADAATLAAAGHSPLLAGRTCTPVAGHGGAVELRRQWPGGRLKDLAGRAVRRVRGGSRGASRTT